MIPVRSTYTEYSLIKSKISWRHGIHCVVAIFLLTFLFTGCVVVKESPITIDVGPIPAGYAVLFLAIPEQEATRDALLYELDISGMGRVFPRGSSLNQILIPKGLHKLQLKRLPQEESNARLISKFEEGQVYRMILLSQEIPVEKQDQSIEIPSTTPQVHYVILPITGKGLEDLLRKTSLPVYNIQTL